MSNCAERRLSDTSPSTAASLRRLAWTASSDWEKLTDQPTPMLCKSTDGDAPIQNIYQVPDGVGGQKVEDAVLAIKTLDVETGIYTDLFSVVGLKNGCDISPVSSWAYCIARNKLARF